MRVIMAANEMPVVNAGNKRCRNQGQNPHTRQDKGGAPLITQGLGRHRLALLLAFLLVIEHGDRLGRQLL